MSSTPAPAAPVAVPAVIDTLVVVAFVLVGRGNHEEGFALGATLATLLPLLVALAAGWAVTRAWRHPRRVVWTGIGIWAVTLSGGMLLRAFTGQGTALAFVLVAAIALALLLIGWRAVAALVARRKPAAA